METGRVDEKMRNKQYRVRLNGSNRVTQRNRRFLRKILPVVDTSNYSPQESQPLIQRQMPVDNETPCIEPEMMEVVDTDVDRQHRHGGWRKSTPNRPTATESGPETHYKSNTPTKVTIPTNAGTGPLLLGVIQASDHKA